MSFLNNIQTTANIVKNAFDKIVQKGGQFVMDASKNTSYLSNAIQTIPNAVYPTSIDATQHVDKTYSVYNKTAENNEYFNYVKVNYQTVVADKQDINIDECLNNIHGTFNISNGTNYFADNVSVNLQTQYYKQLEFLNTSTTCPFPRINAYTVVMGFDCLKDTEVEQITLYDIDGGNKQYMKAYGIACLLSNVNNDISSNILSGKISYNYVDYEIVKKGNVDYTINNVVYGYDYNCDYMSLFSQCGISVKGINDIINNIGKFLGNSYISKGEEYMDISLGTYLQNCTISGYYKLRIYYNINFITNQLTCFNNNIFVPLDYNNASALLIQQRHQSIINNIGNNASVILDPIDETPVRLNYNYINITKG